MLVWRKKGSHEDRHMEVGLEVRDRRCVVGRVPNTLLGEPDHVTRSVALSPFSRQAKFPKNDRVSEFV